MSSTRKVDQSGTVQSIYGVSKLSQPYIWCVAFSGVPNPRCGWGSKIKKGDVNKEKVILVGLSGFD